MSSGLQIIINCINTIDPHIDATNVSSITQAINVLEELFDEEPGKFINHFDGLITLLRAMSNGVVECNTQEKNQVLMFILPITRKYPKLVTEHQERIKSIFEICLTMISRVVENPTT